MERKLTAPPSKKGAKVWIAIVVLMLVVSAFSGAVSAENVSEELGESVTDGGSLTRLEEATNQSAPLGTVSSNLGEQAASLAEAVVSAPYLWGGKGYKWNPSTGGWSGGEFVDSTVIKTGYYFYNPNTGTVTWGIGLDCSGLSFWAFNKAAGATKLIDSSNPVYYEGASGQWNDNTRFEQLSTTIPTVNDLNAGYLLFLDTPDGGFGSPDHVGMYVGNGYVIHSKGGVGVEKKTLNDWLNIPLAGVKNIVIIFSAMVESKRHLVPSSI